jgi:hypothetical protein
MLFDCPDLLLTPSGPRVRLIVATHPTLSTKKPPVGVLRAGTVYELFLTTAPPGAFIAPDVLGLYLHRGSFETVLSDEDQEQDTDRWVSHTPCGQEWWQIFNQWVWNLRLELGQHLETSAMRLTEFAPAHVGEPPGEIACSRLTAPPAPPEPSSETTLAQFGPPQWARAAKTGGICRIGFCSSAGWHASLPKESPSLSSRAATGTGWVSSGRLCRWHQELPPLSLARPLSGVWHDHQASTPRECGPLATFVPLAFLGESCRRIGGHVLDDGFLSSALGRLGTLPDPAPMDTVAPHANRDCDNHSHAHQGDHSHQGGDGADQSTTGTLSP